MKKGFTLIELLVVIAILAVLAVVVVLTLNPVALLQQSRDNNRISDMASLNTAIGLYTADVISGGSLGTPNTVYVSIPDPTATSSAGDQCQGLGLPTLPATYTYQCAASSTYRLTNGTGWIPANLSQTTFGSPVSRLPTDPTNSSSSRLYYTYTTDGTHYEVTSVMESAKYGLGGSADVITPDGGTLATVYEKGSKLGLEPLDYGDSTLVGYWTFDEGSGSTAYDYSGNAQTGSFTGSGQSWVAGRVNRALSLPSTAGMTYSIPSATNIPSTAISVSAWVNVGVFANFSDYFYHSVSVGQANFVLYSYAGGGTSFGIYNTDGSEHDGACFSGSAGQWHLFVGTYDGNTVKLYLDGSQCSQTAADSGVTLYQSATNYGTGVASGANYSIDDVRIYNRALSAAQIAALYNGGK